MLKNNPNKSHIGNTNLFNQNRMKARMNITGGASMNNINNDYKD